MRLKGVACRFHTAMTAPTDDTISMQIGLQLVLESPVFHLFVSFWATTLKWKFPNKTVVPKKEIFSVLDWKKDQTDPEFFVPTPQLWICDGVFLLQCSSSKKDQKDQRLDFQALLAVGHRHSEGRDLTASCHLTPSSLLLIPSSFPPFRWCGTQLVIEPMMWCHCCQYYYCWCWILMA